MFEPIYVGFIVPKSSMCDKNPHSSCACCSSGQVEGTGFQKKKKKTTAMGWSRSGRFALRAQTLLKKRISTKTMDQLGDLEKVAQGRTQSRSSKSLTELNLLAAATCVPARRKHCNADSWLRRWLPCAPSAGPTRFAAGLFFFQDLHKCYTELVEQNPETRCRPSFEAH